MKKILSISLIFSIILNYLLLFKIESLIESFLFIPALISIPTTPILILYLIHFTITKPCPYCKIQINKKAIKCPHCQSIIK